MSDNISVLDQQKAIANQRRRQEELNEVGDGSNVYQDQDNTNGNNPSVLEHKRRIANRRQGHSGDDAGTRSNVLEQQREGVDRRHRDGGMEAGCENVYQDQDNLSGSIPSILEHKQRIANRRQQYRGIANSHVSAKTRSGVWEHAMRWVNNTRQQHDGSMEVGDSNGYQDQHNLSGNNPSFLEHKQRIANRRQEHAGNNSRIRPDVLEQESGWVTRRQQDEFGIDDGSNTYRENNPSLLEYKQRVANRRQEHGRGIGGCEDNGGAPLGALEEETGRVNMRQQHDSGNGVADDSANQSNSDNNNGPVPCIGNNNNHMEIQQDQPDEDEEAEEHTAETTSAQDPGLQSDSDLDAGQVAFHAYTVGDDEEAEVQRERERELQQVLELQAFDELVRTIPHAKEVDPEELRKQHERRARLASAHRRSCWIRIASSLIVLCAVVVTVVALVVDALDKGDDSTVEVKTREQQLAELLWPVSGSEINNRSSQRYTAFRWLVEQDPMQLSVGDDDVEGRTIVERYVMALFFFVTGGPANWTATLGFLSNVSVCNWKETTSTATGGRALFAGVECIPSSRRIAMIQVSNNLYGTLPHELSALQDLVVISLNVNKLFGSIPSSLRNNRLLSTISLGDNDLSGSIPDLSGLGHLKSFSVAVNRLTGTLPNWLTLSPGLEFLNVPYNLLAGTVPPFASQQDLDFVDLASNLFEGTIPTSVGSLSILRSLYAEDNILSGEIPTQIGQLIQLHSFRADGNLLTGTIPTQIGELQTLFGFVVDFNHLTGSIPTEIGHLRNLVHFRVAVNYLAGTLPTELAQLEQLQYLWLYNNSFTGDVTGICDGGDLDLIQFVADCGDNPGEQELLCPCCSHCCNDELGRCSRLQSLEERCLEKARKLEQSAAVDDRSRGTVCGCSEGGEEIFCHDTNCMYCNRDESVCYVDEKAGSTIGMSYGGFGSEIKYVRGRDEHVAFYTRGGFCYGAINGNNCQSCDPVFCHDGHYAFQLDCSNLGYGTVGACASTNDPFYMLWDIIEVLNSELDMPNRFDCIKYNATQVWA